MKLAVGYKPVFIRQYNALDPALQTEVREKIVLFKDRRNHRALRVHKLKSRLRGRYAFSVNYRYRIVFMWFGKKREETVLLAIGDHRVYDE